MTGRLTIILLTLFPAVMPLHSRERMGSRTDTLEFTVDSTFTGILTDTIEIKRKVDINNYSMFGIQSGVALNQMQFNPTKKQAMLITPLNVGVFYTHYCKLFSYMPYFGYQIGLLYGFDGYKFKEDKETGITPSVDGATEGIYEFIELPFMAHFHADAGNHFKMIANLGLYGAYRLSVQRYGDIPEYYSSHFYDYDIRFDYGIRGGVGFAVMFSPLELHIMGQLKWSFGSLYEPDYNSEYYYRFAYPLDIMISAGVHIQLTKRQGSTRASLRKEAHRMVYGE